MRLKYGPKKHLETLFKGFSFPQNELSAVPPDKYADRFVRFIRANVRMKDELRPAKEDLSHIVIPSKRPTMKDGEISPVRTVTDLPGRLIQNLPAIRIQHPSPELKDGPFEREMQNGIQKPLVNGNYFGENAQIDVDNSETAKDVQV